MVVVVETAILIMNVASGQSLVTETNQALDKLPETREEYFSDLESLGCELIEIAESYSYVQLNYESFRLVALKTQVVFFIDWNSRETDFFTIFEGQIFRTRVTYEE